MLKIDDEWASRVLQYEPFVKLFKKLTKKPGILQELDVETVQFIFKNSVCSAPLPFYFYAKDVKEVIEPIIKQTKKYFNLNEFNKKYEKQEYLKSTEIEKELKIILKKIGSDYPEQVKKWKVGLNQNPLQVGYKIQNRTHTILISQISREKWDVAGTIYHEVLIHALRKIKREFHNLEAKNGYIFFEEGLANTVEQLADNNLDWDTKINLTQFSYRPLFLAISTKLGVEKAVNFFRIILKYDEFKTMSLKNLLNRSIMGAKGKKLSEILKMENKKLNEKAANYYNGSLKLLEWTEIIRNNPNDEIINFVNNNLLESKFDPLDLIEKDHKNELNHFILTLKNYKTKIPH